MTHQGCTMDHRLLGFILGLHIIFIGLNWTVLKSEVFAAASPFLVVMLLGIALIPRKE